MPILRHRLFSSCAFCLFVSAAVLAVGGPSAGASNVPKTGAVDVTGYGRVTPQGSSPPVTVEVNRHQAVAIRRALRTLVTLRPSNCHENASAFAITFSQPKGSHRSSALVTEDDCPTPGVVTISERGKLVQTLKESCSMRAAVLAVLPNGKAEGTRQDRNSCSS
jgi:hypothetical protein